MNNFKEYEQYDALGLGCLVRQKKISPAELCEEAIRRIEKINPELNAVITPMFDIAREKAKTDLNDGPFKGVPFLLKDIVSSYAGVPLTGGSKAYENYIPDYDSEMVKRFKKTGLLILGKTNTPEFGLMGVTEPKRFGATRNPWNKDYTPGGSSGGSAAAVASGMVPIASGNDGGGSIRIPASCCGLFGLKATRGRNPTGPVLGRIWQGAAVEGILSRSVRDSAAMLDATHGPDKGAPYTIIPPQRPYLEEIKKDPGKLKIAFCKRSPIGTEVHPDCIAAVNDAAVLLEDMGHAVEEAEPAFDGMALAKSYFTMYYGTVAATLMNLKSHLQREAQSKDVEPLTWTIGLIGKTISAGQFVSAMEEWDNISRIMGKFHDRYDLYLTPTLAVPPVRIGELDPTPFENLCIKIINRLRMGKLLTITGMSDKLALNSLSKSPFTQLANITGQPAVSVPLFWNAQKLPIGVQLIAPFGEEGMLFRIAAQLEKARPWFHKRPNNVNHQYNAEI